MMQIEMHQLELRYEKLRKTSANKEKQLMASVSEMGQLHPIIVVTMPEPNRYVVVDGYKRVRALKRLREDTVQATIWELDEAEALMLERLMRKAESEGPIEQGWLLRELRDRFRMGIEELGRRFDKTPSWVSRRLGLVSDLPSQIQEYVQKGQLGAHAAMKYLVPLARANLEHCNKIAGALAEGRATSRQVGEVYAGWLAATRQKREAIVQDPWVFLRAWEQVRRADDSSKTPLQQIMDDLGAMGGLARRAQRSLASGLWSKLLEPERQELSRCIMQSRHDAQALFEIFDKEQIYVGSKSAHSNSEAS